jgi:hypothetical protein
MYFISFVRAELAAGLWTLALSLPAKSIRFKAATDKPVLSSEFLDSTMTLKLNKIYILWALEDL